MAKKRTTNSGSRSNVPSKGSSSVQTNSFIKGMNKDITPSLENNQAWWHARNVVNNSEDGDLGVIGNEPSNLSCGVIPYTVIGAIHRYGDEWIVYSTDDINSEIGTFDDSECKYTTLVNDTCLNFSTKHLITGAAKENFDCSWQVYWDDGNNPSRSLNIDNIPYKQVQVAGIDVNGEPCSEFVDLEPKKLNCEKIRLAPLVDTPCVEITKATDGGMLQNGSYQVFIAYVENEQKVTDYIGISNVIGLWSHEGTSSSLDISLSNLDQDFFYYEVVLLRRNQGQTSAKKIGIYSTEQDFINIDNVDESLPAVDLVTIPLRSPAYEKSESMFVVNDWLLRQGPTEQFDFNYQPLANNIKVNYVINQQPSTYYHLAGPKVGFMRDEQYAFFIRWIYNTGERSSSYHIPGRAPVMYNTPSGPEMENAIIGGQNVLNQIDGEPVFKVYNTAGAPSLVNEVQPDGSVIIGRGEMAFWESTERYPTNRPDIWGDLCGKKIRHHKMPDESLGSDLRISTTEGDLINLLGVEFSDIAIPLYNDGTPIENIVGYEILRGSRQGAKSILAKGMFKNMRKYDIPGQANLLGTATQGLYPNYPYNCLQDDVYFHKGKAGSSRDQRSGSTDASYCGNPAGPSPQCSTSFTDSLDCYPPLSGYTDDVFTFSSPDLMFTKPFLNAYETKIYGEQHGHSTGYFKASEDHPQFKLLRPVASSLACLIGIGYALHAVQGTTHKTAVPLSGSNADGNAPFVGVVPPLVSSGTQLIYGTSIGVQAGISALWNLVVDALIDTAVDAADLYTGGATSSTELNAIAESRALKAAIPGMYGGGSELGATYDTPESAMPSVLRFMAGISLAQKNIAIGGQEVIDLMYNLIDPADYVLKYNSNGFYNNFIPANINNTFRVKNSDSNYIGSSFQSFDGTKYKINNLFRPSTVAVSTELPLADPFTRDDSRFTLGGSATQDYGDSNLINFQRPFRKTISSLYGALKFNFDNQYGQLDGIKQVQMRGCVELLDPEYAGLYTSKPMFNGDVYINRYTEKCIMPIFTDYLVGQPNEYSFDYSLYVNIPYPRFWLDSSKFDISGLAGEVASLGFASGPWQDKVPTDRYYLDRGNDNCQSTSLFGSIFGSFDTGGDPNPAYNMRYAYMYTHVNGINEFFVESEINLAYRDWEDMPAKRFYDIYEYNDIDALFNASIEKKDNFYKYDDSLSASKFVTQISSFGQIQPRDYDPYVAANCYVNYPKRLIYSLQAQEESKRDYWRVFLNFNYKDFKNEVSVIKPISKNGALVFFPYLSPQLFNGVDTLKLGSNNNVTIGDGKLFSQPFQNVANADISNEYGSCESLRGVINTSAGLFFISQQQGKIFQYAGKGLDPISNNGMKWWFAKYLPSRFIKQFPESENTAWTDNPVAGVGCQVMYDSVDDLVYFMKKDYQLKPAYVADATFSDTASKPVTITSGVWGSINVDIGDPIYFDDCSWTVSYDPKVKAWISFHDWHPELALPSINHFFTTKTITGTIPQCPPGYNFNPANGLCEIGVNETVNAIIDVEEVNASVSGGPQDCLLDIVIAMDCSGSTGTPNYTPMQFDSAGNVIPGTGVMNNTDRATAQMRWLDVFLNNPAIADELAAGNMQIGLQAWAADAAWWTDPAGGYTNPSMASDLTGAFACGWMSTEGFNLTNGGGTNAQQALQPNNPTTSTTGGAFTLLNNKADSDLGDRSGNPFFRQIMITVTDGTNGTPANSGQMAVLQSPNVISGGGQATNTGAWALANLGSNTAQELYGVFCNIGPGAPPNAGILNSLSNTVYSGGPGQNQFVMDSQNQASLDASAAAIAGAVCQIPYVCECPAGYTPVYLNATSSTYTDASGTCDDITPPICRKVTCSCPPSTVTGATTTISGTCPDSAPGIFDIGDPGYINPDPRLCNYFYYDSTPANYNVGGFWRHNVRCDSFVNFYNVDYPWEIDLISNTGQAVNTVRSFQYQLETYVYKGDPQYNMCGGDKWEDLDYNFDASIVYNNDQVSGLLVLTPQPFNRPWANLDYPIITPNNMEILVSKEEHKFRFNQFWDITNDRGEFTNAEQPIFNTSCNGYVRTLNATNLNYNKPQTQRKKFRHYSNQVILRRNVSGNRKMLLRLYNTKLQLSMR